MHRARSSLILTLLLGALSAIPLRATIITNGTFETGDLTGWTRTGETFATAACLASSDFYGRPCTVQSGQYAAAYGPPNPGAFYQVLPTDPGHTYRLEFYLRNDNYGQSASNSLAVLWDGVAIISLANQPDYGYQYFSVSGLLASTASTTLRFNVINVPGAFFFDDIGVVPNPEPGTWLFLASGIALIAVRSVKLRR